MFRLSPPNREQVLAFINSQENLDFSYPEIGATREQAPRNYTVDHNRIQLGAGAETFHRAKAAIHAWKMFDMPWIDLCWPDAQIAPGSTVAVLVSHFGFCSANACRIVYLL